MMTKAQLWKGLPLVLMMACFTTVWGLRFWILNRDGYWVMLILAGVFWITIGVFGIMLMKKE